MSPKYTSPGTSSPENQESLKQSFTSKKTLRFKNESCLVFLALLSAVSGG